MADVDVAASWSALVRELLDQNGRLRALVADQRRVEAALRCVLLFHSGGKWDTEKRAEWATLTHDREATTKVLCDVVRDALDAGRAEKP